MAINTYYFDASDAGPTDPDANWANDANAFDGLTTTLATATLVGDTTTKYLMGEGTNAPSSSQDGIYVVKARIYSKPGYYGQENAAIYTDGLGELLGTCVNLTDIPGGAWGAYLTLTTPSGGWTWDKLSKLETKIYCTNVAGAVYRVEILVSDGGLPGNIGRSLMVGDGMSRNDFAS